MCQALRPQIEHKALQLRTLIAPALPKIAADAGQISQVIRADVLRSERRIFILRTMISRGKS